MPPRLPDDEKFMGDPNIKRWYLNLKEGSIQTAEPRLRRLKLFSRETGIAPEALLKMPKKKRDDAIEDYIRSKPNAAGTYAMSILGSIRSWLQFNYLDLGRKIKIRGAYTPVLEEKIPTHEELREAFHRSGLKSRTIQALIAFAGFRPEVIGNFGGTDGLRIGDLPDLLIEDSKIEFVRIPCLIKVRRSLSKAGHSYFSFLGQEGCDILLAYIKFLAGKGMILRPNSPLIPIGRGKLPLRFCQTQSLSQEVRRDWRPRFTWRPYILRSYFATQTLIGESKAKLPRDYRVFWMGHKGDIESRYTTNKGTLPETLREDMREAYSRCLPSLQTQKVTPDEQDIKKAFKSAMLETAGFSPSEIEEMDLEELTPEQFQSLVRQRLLGVVNNGHSQKVISADQVKQSIGQGWEYVATLPDGEAIVKLPSSR